MRAILLESNPDIALVFPCVFAAVGLSLTVAHTVEDVRAATRNATSDDLIIVDCSLDRPQDRARCLEIVSHTDLDVHIIYTPTARDHALFRQKIACIANGDPTWIPSTIGLLDLVAFVRRWQEQVIQARLLAMAHRHPLTQRQKQVWDLVAQGQSHPAIAATLGISTGTVKRHVERLKDKIGVTSTADLQRAHRWLPQADETDTA